MLQRAPNTPSQPAPPAPPASAGSSPSVRLAFTTHDVLCAGLLWATPIVCGVAMAVWGVQSPSLVALAGLVTLGSSWVYLVAVAIPRARWLREVEGVAEALYRAAGLAYPSGSGNRAQRVTEALRQVKEPVLDRLERSLAEHADMRAVLEATPSPILVTDRSGVVVLSNGAAERMFARASDTLLGKAIDELFTHAEVLGQHAAALAGTSRIGQVRIARPEGLKVFQVATSPLRLRAGGGGEVGSDADGAQGPTGVFVSLRDVTELAVASQLKTDFVANASHELRTPLSSIRAAMETLADGAWDDAGIRDRFAQVIMTNVTRLEEMVRDLLDLSRLETPDAAVNREVVRVAEVVGTLQETFDAVLTERSLTLSFDVEAGLTTLETDRTLLMLIVRNLVDNATKFAYERSTIRVTLSVSPGAVTRGRGARGGAQRGGLRVKVADKGVGIPFGHQQRIFERFYQVDPSRAGFAVRRGTGLGLAIVKHAVKTLGGAIGVESVWKEGTTMTVDLPDCVLPDGGEGSAG